MAFFLSSTSVYLVMIILGWLVL